MPDRSRAIIVDLDGTLADMGERRPYDFMDCGNDQPHPHIVKLVRSYKLVQRVYVLIVSGRKEQCRFITQSWLRAWGVPWDALFMRPDDDNRPDDVFKLELFEREIGPQYNIDFVLDDRNKVVRMWRGIGLPCLQVAEGDF